MSKKQLSNNDIKLLAEIMAKATGTDSSEVEMNIYTPYVCDHCKNDNKEAFPYHVYDSSGRFWYDLCNDCFDELGCEYKEDGEN